MEKFFKALASDKRLKIVYALTLGDMCQTHIEEITKISQVDISRNTTTLLENNIISGTKSKNRVIYSLDEKFKNDNTQLINQIKTNYKYLSESIDTNDLLDRCKSYIVEKENNAI